MINTRRPGLIRTRIAGSTPPATVMICLFCLKDITWLTSTPCKVFYKKGSKEVVELNDTVKTLDLNHNVIRVDRLNQVVPVIERNTFPEYKIGRVCNECKPKLSTDEILPEDINQSKPTKGTEPIYYSGSADARSDRSDLSRPLHAKRVRGEESNLARFAKGE